MKGAGLIPLVCDHCGGIDFHPSTKIPNALECDHCGKNFTKS